MAQILNGSQIGCLSHNLVLDLKKKIQRDSLIRVIIESAQRTMFPCRRKLKCRASLRNLTDLASITPNETR